MVGVPYTLTPTVANGTGPFLWTIIDGDTPGGIDFSSATGELFGSPTTPGTIEFTVRVTDSGNPRQSADVPVTFITLPPRWPSATSRRVSSPRAARTRS